MSPQTSMWKTTPISDRLREALHWKAKVGGEWCDLARAMGVRESVVIAWSYGKRTPNPETLGRISRFLDVRADWLRDGAGVGPENCLRVSGLEAGQLFTLPDYERPEIFLVVRDSDDDILFRKAVVFGYWTDRWMNDARAIGEEVELHDHTPVATVILGSLGSVSGQKTGEVARA